MGNKIPVVARHEFCKSGCMFLHIHLLDAKQVEDSQSFLKVLLQIVTSGMMLNQKEIFTRGEVYFTCIPLYFLFTNSQSIIIVVLIPHFSLLPKPIWNRCYFTWEKSQSFYEVYEGPCNSKQNNADITWRLNHFRKETKVLPIFVFLRSLLYSYLVLLLTILGEQ